MASALRRPTRVLLAAAGAVTLAACGGASESEPPPTPGGEATTVAAPIEAAQRALAAWSGMWRAYAVAGLTANSNEPELARYAADRALATLRDGLNSYASKGQVLKGHLASRPRVAEVSPPNHPTEVTIADCIDTTAFLVYEDGEPEDDEPGGRRSAMGTVTLLTDGWRVTSFGIREVGTCAIASRT